MSDHNKHQFAKIEEEILDTWDAEKTFEASLKQRSKDKLFSFYDGPPFANGMPHYGHLVQTTIKDAATRYKTMRGYYVPRQVGWDTHGLPVEYAIEKEHNFKGKQDIINYGIDKFNAECKQSVFKYQDVWESMFRRVGRWADYSKTYTTLDDTYMESVWWVFKTIYDKGLVYKDFRSTPYCPRCATPLSNFELNQGYQDGVEDPSLIVKFKLANEEAYLLGWTTTPWSLPGNAAIAVSPEADYVYVDLDDDEGKKETVILARERLSILDTDTYHITKEVKGSELVGKSYEPVFALKNLKSIEHGGNLYRVWPAEFVSIEDGTGILHVAPAFGEDDLNLGKINNIPVLITIDENGKVISDLGLPDAIEGKFFKSADKVIIEYLAKQNKIYSAEIIKHTYPFCWRCDTPLLYYATDSWLVRVSDLRNKLVANNQEVNWVPKYIRDGRFGKWLENARDWAISRNRFWGTPLPVWQTDDGEIVVIGSLEELKKRAVEPGKVSDLHRPYIDEVLVKTDSGKMAKRIPEVFDCWFESGSMPYAQHHYPFKDKTGWEKQYPADFIAEAIDQTRGWFYTLHVLATALFDKPAYKNVICSGWIVAADGEKLSKRKKNYAPMDEIFDQYGVDTLRFFMASSPIVNGEDIRFSTEFLRDIQRKIFMTFNNTYNFYKLYADVDGWKPDKNLTNTKSNNVLDKWMLARLNETIAQVTESMDDYRLDRATRPIFDLIDDMSNWFVRRSRRRFWKSEDDKDKQQAYTTLHYALLVTSQLLAPFSPFLSDHIWRKLVHGTNLPSSVHMSDWPKSGKVDQVSLTDMKQIRDIINEGLSQRAAAGIKVRQPLSKLTLAKKIDNLDLYEEIILEELNIKTIDVDANLKQDLMLDIHVTPKLKREGLMRDIVRQVQNARKRANLEVDDRILLDIHTKDAEIAEAIKEHTDTIMVETLAKDLTTNHVQLTHSCSVKVEGKEVVISLKRSQ